MIPAFPLLPGIQCTHSCQSPCTGREGEGTPPRFDGGFSTSHATSYYPIDSSHGNFLSAAPERR